MIINLVNWAIFKNNGKKAEFGIDPAKGYPWANAKKEVV